MPNLTLLSLAFSSGALAFLNPCSFALLPAFVSLFMGKDDEIEEKSRLKTTLEGLRYGFSSTLGFATVFLSIGTLVSWIGPQVRNIMPTAILIVGSLLVVLGLVWAFNQSLFSLSKHGIEVDLSKSSSYLFGIAYALSSLACVFPIFLMLISSSLSSGGFLSGIFVFVSFTFGMGILMTITTTSIALSKNFLIEKFQEAKKYVTRISGIILVLAGVYLIYYWGVNYFL